MTQATEIPGIQTTNNWRFFRLEPGGPLSADGPVDVVVSVFAELGQQEVKIFERGPNGRIRDCSDWLFESREHTDHEQCLREAGYDPVRRDRQ